MWEIDNAEDTEIVALLEQQLDLSPGDVNSEDGKTVKVVCRAVLRRAARLSACSIAAILVLTGRATIDGSSGLGGQIGIAGRQVLISVLI
jgi:hexokinase